MSDDAEFVFYIQAIKGRLDELLRSGWAEKILIQMDSMVEEITEIRCLALGSVQYHLPPRFQLAFLLLIQERYEVPKITAWDPIFNELDARILAFFKIEICEENPEASDTIMWFIPHGPASLIQTLLAKFGGGLYFGNDLGWVEPEHNDEEIKELFQYKVACQILPIQCEKRSRWETAFNNTALHKRVHHPDPMDIARWF